MRIPRLTFPCIAAALLLSALNAPVHAAVTIEVAAGEHDRVGTPIQFELPEAMREGAAIELHPQGDGPAVIVPVQRLPSGGDRPANQAVFILERPLKAGQTRRYQMTAEFAQAGAAGVGACAAEGDATGRVSMDDSGKALRLKTGDKPALQYHYGVVEAPEGVSDLYDRSGYIHPVWSPAGKVITNDFPEKHLHHHGVWFPHTSTTFRGQKTDFWNSGAGEGRIEFVKFDSKGDGPVFGWFRPQHRFIALKAEGGPTPVLDEQWDVKVYGVAQPGFLFDLTSTQTCATGDPLILHEYRYGGIGFRGSGQWEGGGDNCRFLTSEGKTRKDGHATRAKWCAIWQEVDGKPAGVAVLCHPDNFRFPQHMRIHPTEPFFNFAPCQGGEFRIEPGKPYVSKYRFFVFDGEADAAACERAWNDYANPPKVRVVAGE